MLVVYYIYSTAISPHTRDINIISVTHYVISFYPIIGHQVRTAPTTRWIMANYLTRWITVQRSPDGASVSSCNVFVECHWNATTIGYTNRNRIKTMYKKSAVKRDQLAERSEQYPLDSEREWPMLIGYTSEISWQQKKKLDSRHSRTYNNTAQVWQLSDSIRKSRHIVPQTDFILAGTYTVQHNTSSSKALPAVAAALTRSHQSSKSSNGIISYIAVWFTNHHKNDVLVCIEM